MRWVEKARVEVLGRGGWISRVCRVSIGGGGGGGGEEVGGFVALGEEGEEEGARAGG